MKPLIFVYALAVFLLYGGNQIYAETYIITQVIEGSLAEAGQIILKEAYNRIGEEVTFKFLPGERALVQSNAGKYADGEMFRIDRMDEKYSNLLKIPTSYINSENVVFTKRLDIQIAGYESLKPYRIGFRIGLKAAEVGTAGFTGVSQFGKGETPFKLLGLGGVDVVIEERFTGWNHVKKLDLKGIKVLEDPVDSIPLFHYLHKKHRLIVPKLDKAIQEMQKDGTIDRFLLNTVRK